MSQQILPESHVSSEGKIKRVETKVFTLILLSSAYEILPNTLIILTKLTF